MLGDAESLRAVEVACRLAADRSLVTAVAVIEISPLLPLDARMDDEEEDARERLGRAEAIADGYGVRTSLRTVRARDAGTAIAELVEREGCDLVVIAAPRRRRTYGRLAGLGATVRHVLQRAPCRVLVIAS